MGKNWKQSKLLYWTIEIVLIIVGIFFVLQMPNVFRPFLTMLSAIFLPLLVSGFLYYMLDPLVSKMAAKGLPRIFGAIICLAVLILLLVLGVMNIIPQLAHQAVQLSQSLPTYLQETGRWLESIARHPDLQGLDLTNELQSANLTLSNLLNVVLVNVTNSLTTIFSFLMQFFVILFTVPFILLFMFKDGDKFSGALGKFFPASIRSELQETVREMNDTLSAYISSTMIDAVIIGVMSFVAMTLLNQPYALLLAVVCGVTNIIPYLGPFIGAVPAVIVGLFISPWQALYIGLSILVIQQLDGNVIKPLLFGKNLNIHPLTIILVLIAAGSVAGVVGMLICIPVYAVIKTLVLNIRKIWQLRNRRLVSEGEEMSDES
ncbi:AI-2E family transporter [Enterococcus sp. LJL120]